VPVQVGDHANDREHSDDGGHDRPDALAAALLRASLGPALLLPLVPGALDLFRPPLAACHVKEPFDRVERRRTV
jgi:hypothetical protein